MRVNTEKLDEKIEQSGYKIGYICEAMGISREAFNKKRKGITPFRGAEVFVLCTLCNISDDTEKTEIFLP